MAELIQCPICHKDISTKATSCPHCGHRLDDTDISFALIEKRYNQREAELDRKWKRQCGRGSSTLYDESASDKASDMMNQVLKDLLEIQKKSRQGS